MIPTFHHHKAFRTGVFLFCIGLLGFSLQGNFLKASVDPQRGGFYTETSSGNLVGDGGFEQTEIGDLAPPYNNTPWVKAPTNAAIVPDAHVTTAEKRSGNTSAALSSMHMKQSVRVLPQVGNTYQMTAYLKADRGSLTKDDTDYNAEGIQVDMGTGGFTMTSTSSCTKNDDTTLLKTSSNGTNIYTLFRLDSAKTNEGSQIPGGTGTRKYHGTDPQIWNTWQKVTCTFTLAQDKRPTRDQISAIDGPAIPGAPGFGIQFQKICYKKDETSHSNGCGNAELNERYAGGKNATVYIDDVELKLISGNQTVIPAPNPLQFGAIYSSSWKDPVEKQTVLSAKSDYLPADFSNTTSTQRMQQDISQASEAKLNFFAFEWSWDAAQQKGQALQQESIGDFVSQNNSRMNFALLWNLTDADIATSAAFTERVNYIRDQIISKPSYMKTYDGQPILFLSNYDLMRQKNLSADNIKALTNILKTQLNAFSVILFDNDWNFGSSIFGSGTRPRWTRYLYSLGFEGAMKRNYLATFKNRAGWNTTPYDMYQKISETETSDLTAEKDPGDSIGFPLFASVLAGREDFTNGTVLTGNLNESIVPALKIARNAMTYLQPVHQVILIDSWNDYLHGSTLVPSEKRAGTLSVIKNFISCLSTPEKPECLYVK